MLPQGSAAAGGQIYADFQAWFALRLTGGADGANENTGHIEEKVRGVGKELLDFARALG